MTGFALKNMQRIFIRSLKKKSKFYVIQID